MSQAPDPLAAVKVPGFVKHRGRVYETGLCACGCGTTLRIGRTYAQGHDARHRDALVTLLVGPSGNARRTRQRAERINSLIEGLTGRKMQ